MPLTRPASRLLICLGLLLLLAIVLFIFLGKPDPESLRPAGQNRQLTYSFTLKNKTNRAQRDVTFFTHAPVASTSFQKAGPFTASHPFELLSDTSGNQVLKFTFEKIAPFDTKIISVQANVSMIDAPFGLELDEGMYLGPEKYIESNHPEIIKQARVLAKESKLETAQAIFDWVKRSLTYTGYARRARGALWALRQKKGDCTEFAYLFTALCRANTIPSRVMAGYVARANTAVRASSYHNWSEVYIDGAWRVADPQKGVFMKNESSYVATNILKEPTDSTESGLGKFYRFRVEGEGITARMN